MAKRYLFNNSYYSEQDVLKQATADNISIDEYLRLHPEIKVEEIEDPLGIKHASVDQMKKGVSWLQAEGDFVSNMNKYYKDTDVTFQEAAPGSDKFTMYDASTDETSDEFWVPGQFSGYDGEAVSWEGVNVNVKNFFNRTKRVDKKFQAEKTKVENIIASKLEDEVFLQNLFGSDVDWSYVQPQSRGGKGGVGEENDLKNILILLVPL